MNKLIDQVKAAKDELEKKKREVANLKRIAASRKQDGTVGVLTNTLSGKKRPAAAEPEITVLQGPVRGVDESHVEAPANHPNAIQGDENSHVALLNSYKARYGMMGSCSVIICSLWCYSCLRCASMVRCLQDATC